MNNGKKLYRRANQTDISPVACETNVSTFQGILQTLSFFY